jgi:hypothetical protein
MEATMADLIIPNPRTRSDHLPGESCRCSGWMGRRFFFWPPSPATRFNRAEKSENGLRRAQLGVDFRRYLLGDAPCRQPPARLAAFAPGADVLSHAMRAVSASSAS